MTLNTPLLSILCAVILLAGCSSTPSQRYTIDDDIAPNSPISVDHIEDANPQYEPYSLGGNSDYTLRGEKYKIIREPQGFTQEGMASWYGKKFHGHLTSNGEVYDMYSMSAAHKTLPIPSYVKVTNKDNGKTAIVRVNDRGPFHEGRIIDLSFAAATKLDVIRTGTANVAIEVISVGKPTEAHKQKALPKFVVQVASSQHEDRVRTLAQDLSQTLSVKSYVNSDKNIHRVFLGPFDDYMLTQKALEQVKLMGYSSAFIKSQ
ncbi:MULTISPECIES: septal ring lytic transglycosylase RlpA family protein [Vibrio]|uniref:septal ring lytic transglycosylase RlpA family protein n=1 Tax=Vibrio TaxID=662 RepID=UPI002075AF3F|nr:MULTISPECIES: septal ring lytic transglycosylase RlpA family protein [Vibrio]USD31863.1 septal ring lytic transglycosylase RlpA family protein [Vibrio sp. SCSIO 43186]USD44908.1 septal ring lytic transglycosylase RlpA family protein [Vibrio sp. SCSIO 43145]USD68986.1 septal ring lytic transglycosylase RlpA family protein [Vibrio sp. SCSIO 43139]USD96674.1 septal ring lytic transglycosylase RlpA [Vibrio coralliilyticus]